MATANAKPVKGGSKGRPSDFRNTKAHHLSIQVNHHGKAAQPGYNNNHNNNSSLNDSDNEHHIEDDDDDDHDNN